MAPMSGEELRSIRKRIGLTQVQMADELGWRSNSVARAERSEMPITEPIAKLARLLLKVRLDEKRRRRREG